MSTTSKSGDLTFKSSSEIRSFVINALEKPGYTGGGAYIDKTVNRSWGGPNFTGEFIEPGGRNIITDFGYLDFIKLLIFRSLFNPIDYKGGLFKELKKKWYENELGFMIGALSLVASF